MLLCFGKYSNGCRLGTTAPRRALGCLAFIDFQVVSRVQYDYGIKNTFIYLLVFLIRFEGREKLRKLKACLGEAARKLTVCTLYLVGIQIHKPHGERELVDT